MITYFKNLEDGKLRQVKDFVPGCWISVVDPSSYDIVLLSEKLSLDVEELESGLDQNEIPRVDVYDGFTYIFTNAVLPDNTIITFLIVLGEQFILTLSKKSPSFLDKIADGRISFVTSEKTKCLVRILNAVNSDFEKSTISTVKVIRSKKTRTNELKEKDLNILLEHEEFLNDLSSSYNQMKLMYERLRKRVVFPEAEAEEINDLILEAEEGVNLCLSYLKTISNIRNYTHILLSNKLNRVITILTVFTILISIPAAVSGFYGMNIRLPLQESPDAFLYVLGFVVLLWVVLAFYLKRKDVF